MEINPAILVLVAVLAFLCQYASISLGTGYGTALVPLLLIIGFAPLEVVPAVLLSQLVGGTVGGLAHHRAGNISLDFRRDEEVIKERLRRFGYLPRSFDAKVIFILASCGIFGALGGVFVAVHIPKVVLEAYVGILVLGVGALILCKRGTGAFSWRALIALGLVSSFNKGISGGGYVPVVTGAQIISGRGVKSSVGSTALAVGLVCAVSFLGYVLLEEEIRWALAAATSAGSVVAAPFAATMVRKADPDKLKIIIGLVTAALGALTLIRVFVF